MSHSKKGILILIIILLIIHFFLVAWHEELIPHMLYPTKSDSYRLSLVTRQHTVNPIITLKYVDSNQTVSIYSLKILSGLHEREPQSYNFPKLDRGIVEVNINLRDEGQGNFTVSYNAEKLYRKGLLIYMGESFVQLRSGSEKVEYQWDNNMNTWHMAERDQQSALSRIPNQEHVGYKVIHSE